MTDLRSAQLMERSAFVGKATRRYVTVTIQDFGSVRIQSLSEREAADYDTQNLDQRGRWRKRLAAGARRRLIALCLVDADGNRLFTDSEADDLADMDGRIADAIYEECVAHCGFRADQVEAAEKN
jgi:hypothetical protein